MRAMCRSAPFVKMSAEPHHVSTPRTIGEYRVEKTLGEGTYSVVKLGTHVVHGQKVRRVDTSEWEKQRKMAAVNFVEMTGEAHTMCVGATGGSQDSRQEQDQEPALSATHPPGDQLADHDSPSAHCDTAPGHGNTRLVLVGMVVLYAWADEIC